MKELSIEEKAKAYDEAYEKTVVRFGSNVADEIFHELKESEDERTKEDIIIYLSTVEDKELIPYEAWIAWLEKQGEQKPTIIIPKFRVGDEIKTTNETPLTITKIDEKGYWSESLFICSFDNADKWKLVEQKPDDKVEPKFKVGDWITDGHKTHQINNVNGSLYGLDNSGYSCALEDNFHLWTIQDAKGGDVLCTYECDEPKIVFILKGTPKKHYALSYYCYYNIMYPHFGSDSEKGCLAPNDEDVKPATKEQRDTLLKAITDAGYTFDFEKKELNKIEQKPAWSEEDEQIKVCKEVYADILSAKGFDLGTVNSELNRLEEQLKKLMEE